MVGANDERAEEKIRGMTLAGAYVDEASVLPESFCKMLLTRLSVEGARLYATTNPDSPMHWLKRDYLDRASLWICGDGERCRAKTTPRPGPLQLPPRRQPDLGAVYVEALKSRADRALAPAHDPR